MSDPVPACFGGRSAVGPPATTAAGPSQATSVYETGLGVAALTWTRTVLGLLVGVNLRLDDGETLSFKIRPWLLWKRKGSKKLHLKNRLLDLAWDLSRAVFPVSGGPEPESGYYFAVAVDGDLLLVAGDLEAEARKKTRMVPIEEKTVLISRREHVATGAELSYSTTASFGGKKRSIAIDLDGEMNLAVDGKRILQIRRLRWKFRGSERVELGGGDRIQVSWDLHSWMFPAKKDGAGERDDEDIPHAMFVFRFEGEGHFGNSEGFGYLGKSWSESGSSSSGGGGERKGKGRREKEEKMKTKKKSLLKTSSSSSSSSASSAGSSTVMEWSSQEEEELQSRRGFTLLVYAWKE